MGFRIRFFHEILSFISDLDYAQPYYVLSYYIRRSVHHGSRPAAAAGLFYEKL